MLLTYCTYHRACARSGWIRCRKDVAFLLRIAAGDSSAMREASRVTDRSSEVIRNAAAFFIEQILLAAESDSYRVLGANPNATASELRHHMALLIKWLHPDSAQEGSQSIFANRVTVAWDNLKTAERRAAYDQARRTPKPKRRPNHVAQRLYAEISAYLSCDTTLRYRLGTGFSVEHSGFCSGARKVDEGWSTAGAICRMLLGTGERC